MFVVGNNNHDVNEYTLSTAFNISSAVFVDTLSVPDSGRPFDVKFNNDGSKMFLAGRLVQLKSKSI